MTTGERVAYADLFDQLLDLFGAMLVVNRWHAKPSESPSPARIAETMRAMERSLATILSRSGWCEAIMPRVDGLDDNLRTTRLVAALRRLESVEEVLRRWPEGVRLIDLRCDLLRAAEDLREVVMSDVGDRRGRRAKERLGGRVD